MTAGRISANASATRGFFVDMLVRDISVDAAILDLIDNAVDAASGRSGDNGDLSEFRVAVTIDSDRFSISDNCGGIPLAIAENYAFRFGRPDDFNPPTPIGRFGIGMKRAVFRLGRQFTVDSSTTESRFIVDVDVDEWRNGDGPWEFPMDITRDPVAEPGTTVGVLELHESVGARFSEENYPHVMLAEIASTYDHVIGRGLEITVNGTAADLRLRELLAGEGIQPEHQTMKLESRGHSVELRIIAGISADVRAPVSESGWYVYCNGRQVLGADRTPATGWGTADPHLAEDVPAWHPQYARFRGFALFTSDHPEALPWTTTKGEIDESSEVYRNALAKMRSVIRSFANFTNTLGQERARFEEGGGRDPQPIRIAVERAGSVVVLDAPPDKKFRVPERDKTTSPIPLPTTASIQFRAERSQIENLKEVLRLTTNREVGELGFRRLYEEEVGEQ